MSFGWDLGTFLVNLLVPFTPLRDWLKHWASRLWPQDRVIYLLNTKLIDPMNNELIAPLNAMRTELQQLAAQVQQSLQDEVIRSLNDKSIVPMNEKLIKPFGAMRTDLQQLVAQDGPLQQFLTDLKADMNTLKELQTELTTERAALKEREDTILRQEKQIEDVISDAMRGLASAHGSP